ncbi:conserved hypothetical protein [Haloferula helveola]|uniref:Uncharacterized protein n=1 Tax=Haloferula helveola TaxID=490095 RepID=A0ABN6H162_9BACT|nr:conserved hypothetical protein [Haloferula helveola]
MSKAPKNIEKILLGAAVVVGGGLAAVGFMKLGKVEEEFSDAGGQPRPGETAVVGAEKVPGVINSLASDRTIAAATVPSDRLKGGERPVDLFIGVPLFAQRENPNEPIDLLNSPDVHDEIPNIWWIENGVSPNFADSPQRDEDGDGFSNLEEFTAKTHPANDNSHPELATKLAYVGDETVTWLLEFGFEAGGKWIPKVEILEGEGKGQKNRVDFQGGLEPGDTFFAEDPFKDRFKFTGIEERKVRNERLNVDETLRFGLFEDLKENKKGEKYEVPNRVPKAQKPDYYHYDRTAILELNAVGEGGKQFKVEENTKFSLPSGGEEKNYLLKRVTPDEIEVEWDADGETKSLVIPRK